MEDLQKLYDTLTHDLAIIDQIAAAYGEQDREVKAIEAERLKIIGLIEAGDPESLEQVRKYFEKEANSDQ